MTKRRFRVIAGILAMTLCGSKCSRPQQAFLSVQVCLGDEKESNKLADIMRDIAAKEGLTFSDGSDETRDYLKGVRDKGQVKLDHLPTINMGIEGKDGLGVTAGNLGLPSKEVALGFTAGSDAAKAHRLADRLVQALSQRWHVETIPQGEGAFPMKSCGD